MTKFPLTSDKVPCFVPFTVMVAPGKGRLSSDEIILPLIDEGGIAALSVRTAFVSVLFSAIAALLTAGIAAVTAESYVTGMSSFFNTSCCFSFSEASSSAAMAASWFTPDFFSTGVFSGDSTDSNSLISFTASALGIVISPALFSGWLNAISSILFSGRLSSRIVVIAKSAVTEAAMPYQSLRFPPEIRFPSLLFNSARSLPAASVSRLLKPSDASSVKGSF